MTGSAHSSEVLVGEGDVEVSVGRSILCVRFADECLAARTGEGVHLPLGIREHRCPRCLSSRQCELKQ